MAERNGPGSEAGAPSTTPIAAPNPTASQQVAWFEVHTFVAAVLNQMNGWPMAGTPAWCSLADDDPAKWAAVLDGGQHWALHVDSCQMQRCETSKAVAGAADWPAVAWEIQQRSNFYDAKPWLRHGGVR